MEHAYSREEQASLIAAHAVNDIEQAAESDASVSVAHVHRRHECPSDDTTWTAAARLGSTLPVVVFTRGERAVDVLDE
jgi:hypothetical protein